MFCRCFQMFSDVLRCFQMFSGCSQLSQTFYRHSQTCSRCVQMFIDGFICSQDALRICPWCSQTHLIFVTTITADGYIKQIVNFSNWNSKNCFSHSKKITLSMFSGYSYDILGYSGGSGWPGGSYGSNVSSATSARSSWISLTPASR